MIVPGDFGRSQWDHRRHIVVGFRILPSYPERCRIIDPHFRILVGHERCELRVQLRLEILDAASIVKNREGLAIQMVNKAVAGSLQAACLVIGWDQQALEKEAERQRRSPRNPALRVEDMTDEKLMSMVTERAVRIEQSTTNGGDGRILSDPGVLGE